VAPEHLASRLRAAAERLDGVCAELVAATPEALDRCAGRLESACQELAEISPASVGDSAATLAAARQFHAKIRRTRRLLDGIWRFHERWGQMLGAQTGGYLAGGKAALTPGGSRLSWSG